MPLKRLLGRSFVLRLTFIGIAFALMSQPLMQGLGQINPNNPISTFQSDDPVLSDQRLQHILYGDSHGGGHIHGAGKPCKSEFPANWDAGKIEKTIITTAANDNLSWKTQDNGYAVTTVRVEDVSLRLVINPDNNEIITAYPVNVKRNPCPAVANDNSG